MSKTLQTSRGQIRAYWHPYAHLFPAFHLDLHEMHDAEITEEGERAACWACGMYSKLERCHLIARCDGGSDDPSNLHLLCHACHKQSEVINNQAYAYWLAAQAYGGLRRTDQSFMYHLPRVVELMSYAWSPVTKTGEA